MSEEVLPPGFRETYSKPGTVPTWQRKLMESKPTFEDEVFSTMVDSFEVAAPYGLAGFVMGSCITYLKEVKALRKRLVADAEEARIRAEANAKSRALAPAPNPATSHLYVRPLSSAEYRQALHASVKKPVLNIPEEIAGKVWRGGWTFGFVTAVFMTVLEVNDSFFRRPRDHIAYGLAGFGGTVFPVLVFNPKPLNGILRAGGVGLVVGVAAYVYDKMQPGALLKPQSDAPRLHTRFNEKFAKFIGPGGTQ